MEKIGSMDRNIEKYIKAFGQNYFDPSCYDPNPAVRLYIFLDGVLGDVIGDVSEEEIQKAADNISKIDAKIQEAIKKVYGERCYADTEPHFYGVLVSYLINEKCPDKEVYLKLPKLNYVGIFNSEKKIEVECEEGGLGDYAGAWMRGGGELVIDGDVGSYPGAYMEGGKLKIKGSVKGCYAGVGMKEGEIEIDGDVKNCGTWMEGGLIKVHGNAESSVGGCMKGGRIEIDGNVGKMAGNDMEGGELIIKGNVDGYGFAKEMKGGKIEVYGDVVGGKWSSMGDGMTGGEIIIHGDFIPGWSLAPWYGVRGGTIRIEGRYDGKLPKEIYGGNVYIGGKQVIKDGKRVESLLEKILKFKPI